MELFAVVGLGIMSMLSCAMVMKPPLTQQLAKLFRLVRTQRTSTEVVE